MPSAVRSRLLPLSLGVAAMLVLAGCASGAPAADGESSAPAATRTVQQESGDVVIPEEPQRIVALDEYAALELLSVGVQPTVVYASLQSPLAAAALADADGVEIVDAPTFLSSPDLEDVADREGDVLVMSGTGPLMATLEQISAIAPTVVIPNEDWRDSLGFTGEAFGVQEEAERVAEVLDARFADLAERSPDLGTVSVLFGFQGAIYSPSSGSPLSGEIEDAGVNRLALQAETDAPPEADNIVPVAAEELPRHAADLTILLDQGYYEAQTVRDAPTFSGASVAVDGDAWFGQHPLGVFWLQEDLLALTDGREPGAVQADAVTRWEAFLDAVR